MLHNLSKISYKLSTNAIFILFSIIADFLLDSKSYGQFIIIITIQILIFNFIDIFNTKYLLGEFSKKAKLISFNKYFFFKVYYAFFPLFVLSLLYLIYDVDIIIIFLLIVINYFQLMTSTISTYIFINEKNGKLFFITSISFLIGITYLVYFYTIEEVSLIQLIIGILLYRVSEFLFLFFSSKKYFKKYKVSRLKIDLIKAYPFYFQLLLSISSSKLFILFLPYFLSYEKISIIGTYEYIIALPLFFLSILAMTSYSELFKLKLDETFKIGLYDNLMNNYYKKSLIIISCFLIIQLFIITMFKQELIEFIPYFIFNDIIIIFSSLQGFLLFFWKMNKIVIYISIFVLLIKNSLMLFILKEYDLDGFFIFSLLLEFSIIFFIKYKIAKKKLKIRNIDNE